MKDLRFGNRLASTKPDDEPESEISDRKLDEVTARHGFTSREPTQKIVRRRQRHQPTLISGLPFRRTIDVPWAMGYRLSYPEAPNRNDGPR